MHDILCGLGGCLQALGFFGGIALIIRASAKAKMERMKAERQMWQPVAAPSGDVAAELRALAQQVRQHDAVAVLVGRDALLAQQREPAVLLG